MKNFVTLFWWRIFGDVIWWRHKNYVIIDILEVLLRYNRFVRTTNWRNHATSDYQDAKNSKISNIFTKLDNWEGMIMLQ